jgi:hypothetical protein
MKRTLWGVATLAVLGLVACSSTPSGSGFGDDPNNNNKDGSVSDLDGGVEDPGPTFGDGSTIDASGGDECKKIDLVFVVDNSGSMGQEQANLTSNFPNFITTLNGFRTKGGDPLDYRVAVTTTDNSTDRGAFRRTGANGCNPGPTRPWLERNDANLSQAFSCRANVGTSGSSSEVGLECMKQALTTRMTDGTNKANGQDFLRQDALLAFIIITDEDESSSVAINTYPPVFDGVKTIGATSGKGRWAAAVIAGFNAQGVAQTCSSTQFGSAGAATRYGQFITLAGKNGVASSICAGDLTVGLTAALNTFEQACKNLPPVR